MKSVLYAQLKRNVHKPPSGGMHYKGAILRLSKDIPYKLDGYLYYVYDMDGHELGGIKAENFNDYFIIINFCTNIMKLIDSYVQTN